MQGRQGAFRMRERQAHDLALLVAASKEAKPASGHEQQRACHVAGTRHHGGPRTCSGSNAVGAVAAVPLERHASTELLRQAVG